MDKPLAIATSQVPFIVYLVVAGMVGVLIENTQYIYMPCFYYRFLVVWRVGSAQ
jgi:hypothetical protein